MAWINPDTYTKPATGVQGLGAWGGMVHDNLKDLDSRHRNLDSRHEDLDSRHEDLDSRHEALDDLLVSNRPYCIATRGPATAIAAGDNDLVLTGVVADSMGGWNVANPTWIRLIEPGWYTVFAPLMFSATAVDILVRVRDVATGKDLALEQVNFTSAVPSGSNISRRIYSNGTRVLKTAMWTSAAGATLQQDSVWGVVWEHR